MSRNTLLGAACLLLVGLLVGYIAGSGGPSLKEIDQAVTARIDAATKAEADRTAALEAKVADLGTQVDAVSTQVTSSADTLAGLGARIGGDLANLGTQIGDTVSAAGASSAAALQSGLDKLQDRLAAATAAKPEAKAPAAAAPASEPEAAPVAGDEPAAGGEPSGTPAGNTAGETVVLSETARVFISRVDDAAGEALVYIEGEPTTLKAGQTAPFQVGGKDCELTLDAVDRGHATLTGACGSDLPPAQGTAPGTAEVLADGAVRVFVSSVDAQGARIAINGVTTQDVAVGETVEVTSGEKACKVTVAGVDRGRVALEASCS